MDQINAKQTELPLLMHLDTLSPDEFINYYKEHQPDIETDLLNAGAIKFKGINIQSLQDFQHIVDAIASKFLNYIDGNSPRTKLSGNVYTSTEYDKTQRITMHNELSYSAKWPGKLFFSCLTPAETGGETLLADSREILEVMDKDIVEEVETKGIIYIRNLHGGMGVGPSWQDTFETSDKQQLEKYCRAYNITYEWKDGENLKLIQPAKGIIQHRINGDKLWFNQIDQFHPCHLASDVYDMMKSLFDSPEDFPMYVKFGDGSHISEQLIKQVMDAIDKVTLAPKWENNELLIVDNELVTHGRAAFTGERKVLVAMTE